MLSEITETNLSLFERPAKLEKKKENKGGRGDGTKQDANHGTHPTCYKLKNTAPHYIKK